MPTLPRRALSVVPLAVALLVTGSPVGADRGAAGDLGDSRPESPNVIVMMLDDATVDDVEQMPNVQRLLADQGITFTSFYAPFPQCCPARASALTGQYPHNHRVLDIKPPFGGFEAFDDRHTIATYLDPGYRTGIFGKYLNGFDAQSQVSPGWDVFRVPVRGVYNYVGQRIMHEDGSLEDVEGYLPSVHADQMMDFIEATPAGEPYLAYLGWVAPHNGSPEDVEGEPPSPYVARALRGTYAGERVPRDPSFNERNVDDKRRAVRERPRLGSRKVAAIAETRSQRRETLMAVDAKVQEVVDLVAARGELDDTYFLFTSDNGFMEGQHRISEGKLQMYEPSAAVPLIIRGPGFAPGSTYRRVAGLQDLAPTLLDLAGVEADPDAPEIDGVSLRGLVDGDVSTRRPQVVEIADNSRIRNERRAGPAWLARAVVTNGQWKYVEYPLTDEVEMYHLRNDPYELRNLARGPEHRRKEAELRRLLHRYRNCAGAACS